MYIKHMSLVCSTSTKMVPNTSFIESGPVRIYGTAKALYRRLYQYRWATDSGGERLFRRYQSIQTNNGRELQSTCGGCPMKVKCLLSSHSDREYKWPVDVCMNVDGYSPTLPDRHFHEKKVTVNKFHFIMENKCGSCALNQSCYNYGMIVRMLCPHYIRKEDLFNKAERAISGIWGSVNRFMAAMTLGWQRLTWRPHEAKRERRYRIVSIHPDQSIDLIQDYYPYRLRIGSIQSKMFGLCIPEEGSIEYTSDDVLTSWILWQFVHAQLQNSDKRRNTNLGRLYICGHRNFLLSMHASPYGHPILETATARYKYSVTFERFDHIGYKLGWRPSTVLQYFK